MTRIEKSKKEEILLAIKSILNEIDPLSFSPGSASPEEEYKPEAEAILGALEQIKTEEELLNKIDSIFKEWFGQEMKINPDDERLIAKKIFAIRNK